jgi:hypothetical protein
VAGVTEGRHGVEMAGQEESPGPAESGAGHHRVAVTVDGQVAGVAQSRLDPVGQSGLLMTDRRDVHQLRGQGQKIGHDGDALSVT